MSRRIQCNTLCVKPKPDGTCGNIECETISCKNIVCESQKSQSNIPSCFNIPYSLQVSHISLGMMGTGETDCSHQIIYSPCAFKTTHISFIWHDWLPGYPKESLFYKVNDNKWEKIVLKESQVNVDFVSEIKQNDKIVVKMYSNPIDEKEPSASVQSLSMNLVGNHEIKLS